MLEEKCEIDLLRILVFSHSINLLFFGTTELLHLFYASLVFSFNNKSCKRKGLSPLFPVSVLKQFFFCLLRTCRVHYPLFWTGEQIAINEINIIRISHLLEITFSITINQENLQCDVSSQLTSYHLTSIVTPLPLVKLRHR